MHASLRLRCGITVSSRCNAGVASASPWHHSVFTLAMQASLGFAVASQWLHAGKSSLATASQWLRSFFTPLIQASLGIAVASQRLHAVYTLCIGSYAVSSRCVRTWASVLHRCGITVASCCQCRSRFGFAVASQWLRCVFTPTMQASLGFAVASQRLHAIMQASLRLRCGIAVAS